MGYKELDDIRSSLNHNKIKNDFILKIRGTADKDKSGLKKVLGLRFAGILYEIHLLSTMNLRILKNQYLSH